MKQERYKRIVTALGSLTRLPVRLIEDRGEGFLGNTVCTAGLDDLTLLESLPLPRELLAKGKIGYAIGDWGEAYAYLRLSEGPLLLIGPSLLEKRSPNELSPLFLSLGLEESQAEGAAEAAALLPVYSLRQLADLSYLLASCLSEEEIEAPLLPFEEREAKGPSIEPDRPISEQAANSSLQSEKAIRGFIVAGDVEGFSSWVSKLPKTTFGHLANEPLRETKNIFICATTTSSRAAIEGGMSPALALSASDRFILKAEKCLTPSEVFRLQFDMVKYYVEEVAKLNQGKPMSDLLRKVSSYCQRHRGEVLRVEGLSEEISWSRSYLSTRFKKETGMTIVEYFHRYKCEEAKRLLKAGISLSDISARLAFSSPSHFSRVFKKYAGISPKDYR